jgi:PITH domain
VHLSPHRPSPTVDVTTVPPTTIDMEMFPEAAAGSAGDAGGAAEVPDDGKLVELSSKIETKNCYARNVSPSFPFTNLFIGDSRLGCKSDADEQLLVHIAFKEFVKIKSIKFVEFNGGLDPESNPSKVHLFVNRENMGFEDCDDVDPTQTLHLTSEDLKEGAEPIALRYVLYQRVTSLTIFVEDNQGGEVTALGGIKLYGRPTDNVNMADFKKQPEH